MRRLECVEAAEQKQKQNTVSVSLPLLDSLAQSLIQIERRTPKRNSPPLSSPPKSSWWFSPVQQFSPQPPNQGRHRVLPAADLPQNKSLAGGGRLALASMAFLLADYDGDWRLRLLDYSRPPPTAFPLMAWQEGTRSMGGC